MIQPESEGSAHGHSIARLEVLRYDLEKNEKREECGLRHELSPEQSQHGDSNDVLRTSKYGESNASALEDLTLRPGSSIKEVLLMNLPDHRHIRQYLMFIANPYKCGLSRWHYYLTPILIFLKDIKNSKVKLRTVTTREVVSYDELDEIASFQDKYEQDGQNHKMIKKVKQDDDARLKISRTQSQKTKAQDRRSKHEGTRTL
ncbi:hypothetical protein Tco_1002564 [Tanacetum coccineum]|uniref:Uncharacterized protein n=1 Tax=Tanacetum coccineum TaxID=301880 RepID=A0ABQ5F6L4_9ASTR